MYEIILMLAALSGGHLSCLSCSQGSYQIHSLKLQSYPCGMFSFSIIFLTPIWFGSLAENLKHNWKIYFSNVLNLCWFIVYFSAVSWLFQHFMEYHLDLVPQQGLATESFICTRYIIFIILMYHADISYFSLYSTRVANELGAGNPRAARLAVYAAMFLAVSETIIVTSALFASRRVFGYLFSNEKEVIDYVTTMAPLVCLSVIMDSLQGVLSG